MGNQTLKKLEVSAYIAEHWKQINSISVRNVIVNN